MKKEIRKQLKEIRKNLSKNEVLEKSKIIKEKLFEIKEFKQASTILFYVSYNNEVSTHDMIKDCIFKNVKIVVPISVKKTRSLILSKLKSWNDLETGSYGILEPKKDKIKEISIDEINLIIVPGVGFDKKGRRIGHGKGYYDNLLKTAKKAFHIGLAFENQILDEIPTDSFDFPVHMIITEDRVIYCS
jgi:5-formyltetrahydrofolate cyclo-ligase